MSYWLFLFGALIVLAGFLAAGGAAAAGWTGYAPLTDADVRSPVSGWTCGSSGLLLVGISSVLGAINLIATIFGLRAPGMAHVADADLHLEHPGDVGPHPARLPAAHGRVRDAVHRPALRRRPSSTPAHGGDAILWQHLFWFFGHPEVYILILPFFGVITEIIPVFSRKPVFGYVAFVLATMAIAGLSMAVWAHHMFTTGAVDNSVLLPSRRSRSPCRPASSSSTGSARCGAADLTFATPMLWAIGFL